MQILIAQVVKFLVDFFKNLLADAKLKELDKDYEEKRNEARKQIEEAAQAADDFLFGYELHVRDDGTAEVQLTEPVPEPPADVREPTESVRESSERTEGSNKISPERARSERAAAYRAAEAARRRKGRGKKG